MMLHICKLDLQLILLRSLTHLDVCSRHRRAAAVGCKPAAQQSGILDTDTISARLDPLSRYVPPCIHPSHALCIRCWHLPTLTTSDCIAFRYVPSTAIPQSLCLAASSLLRLKHNRSWWLPLMFGKQAVPHKEVCCHPAAESSLSFLQALNTENNQLASLEVRNS